MRTYITGNSEKVIIVVTDIFGLDEGSRVKEVSDELSKYGYKIIIPDIFRGKAYSKGNNL
jgi:dienelactone hydrolase